MRPNYPRRAGVVEVEAATLRYVVEGRGEPVVVLGSSIYYPRTFSGRLREGREWTFVDCRHFARGDGSSPLREVGIRTYVEDLEAVRIALGLERFVLVGHSHHGNLALEYAKRRPGRVTHLVLIGSPPYGATRTVEAARRFWRDHASERRKAQWRRSRERFDARAVSMSPEQEFVARYVADGPRYWFDPTYDASPLWEGVPIDLHALNAFKGFFADLGLTWDPMKLSAPVLVVMGRHDYAVPHVLWDDALPGLPEVSYHLLEASGHTPQLEAPDVFDPLLRAWLETGRPGTEQETVSAPGGTD